MADDENPFLSLFLTSNEVKTAQEKVEKETYRLTNVITRVLMVKGGDDISTDNLKNVLILQEENVITLDNYDKVLVKRLQLSNLSQYINVRSKGMDHSLYTREHCVEPSPINYLLHCYIRIQLESVDSKVEPWKSELLKRLRKTIIEMAGAMILSAQNMCVAQGRNPSESDFVHLFMSTVSKGMPQSIEFFKEVAISQTPSNIGVIFNPLLSHIYTRCVDLDLLSADFHLLIDAITVFAQVSTLANLLVRSSYWWPDKNKTINGKGYQSHTILGRLLSPSTLPASLMQPAEHFMDIQSLHQLESVTNSLRTHLETNSNKLYIFVSSLLRQGEEVKEQVIQWLVSCFKANADRGKMLSRMQGGPLLHVASDGFFLNLSWVMLRLSAPFTVTNSPKLLTIDPKYCLLNKAQYNKAYVDFTQDTKMTSKDDSSCDVSSCGDPIIPVKFVSHCFFLTHKCLSLGLTQIILLSRDMIHSLSRIQQIEGVHSPRYKLVHAHFLAIRAHSRDPLLLELCLNFYTATGTWLVELIKQGGHPNIFPIPEQAPPTLLILPESIVENLADFTLYLSSDIKSEIMPEAIETQHQLVTFCTVFMGCPQLLANPHLRAKLAHLLSLFTSKSEENQGLVSVYDNQVALFESHSIAVNNLFSSLLTIFIDIEHTGDSMEFEDKFQYRLPMYAVIKFLWNIPCYHDNLRSLGDQVDDALTKARAPLFLRFMNMLINDATLQLDEGLQNLTVIKEIELLKDSSEWEELTNEQKKGHNDRLSEAIMYAKNRNTLALKTVNILELITSDITKPFVSSSILDQTVAMLNYFLKQLSGQKSKDFNVRDREKYNFDPKELVSSIIKIYINLGREPLFCQAIPRDGRSFSMELFDQVLNVMKRVGLPVELYTGLVKMKERVQKYYQQLHIEEELMDDAPDEYLDPLMSTLMEDPVTLPTSGKVMERTVVMRHLLSDQTDPFNRKPLTADMLIPNEELRQKISEWKLERIKQ